MQDPERLKKVLENTKNFGVRTADGNPELDLKELKTYISAGDAAEGR